VREERNGRERGREKRAGREWEKEGEERKEIKFPEILGARPIGWWCND